MKKQKHVSKEKTTTEYSRKDFLSNAVKTVVPASFALAAASCSPKEKQTTEKGNSLPKLKWTLTSSFPRSLDILFGASEYFAERVKVLSSGKFIIRVHPAGEIVPGLQVFDSVQQGAVELGQTVGYYYIGKHPAFAFEAGVPLGLNMRQQVAWMTSEGNDLLAPLFSKFNIVAIPMGNTGAQMGGWFRKPINSLADLKGLRMRIPGLGGQVMAELGVNVQNIAGGDIYSALERGAIDATEWVGPYDDEKLGFYKAAKNYYYPGWWERGSQFSIYINQDKWNSLPPAYQEILRSACSDTYLNTMMQFDIKNPEALQRLLKKGVVLQKYSDDIIAKGKEIAERLMQENADKDADYKKIYTSWKAYRDSSAHWFNELESSLKL